MTGSCCWCVLEERGVAEHKLSGMVVALFQHSDCDRGCRMSFDDVDGAHECEHKSNDVDVEDSTCRYPWDEKQSFVVAYCKTFPARSRMGTSDSSHPVPNGLDGCHASGRLTKDWQHLHTLALRPFWPSRSVHDRQSYRLQLLGRDHAYHLSPKSTTSTKIAGSSV